MLQQLCRGGVRMDGDSCDNEKQTKHGTDRNDVTRTRTEFNTNDGIDTQHSAVCFAYVYAHAHTHVCVSLDID